MNKKETIAKVSDLSNVPSADCEKVLEALEVVMAEELSTKKGFRKLINILEKIISVLKNKLSIILLFLLFSATSFGQGQLTQNIRGLVTDRLSGEVLMDVSIDLPDLPNISTKTDRNGQFVLEKVPLGRHTLRASFVGYEPTFVKEVMLNSSKEIVLEIAMRASELVLEEVVVTVVSNKEQVPNNMALTGGRVLRMEEASRYAGGMDDPARLASSFAGVSPSMGNNGISVHGNAPSLLQWRLEGVEIPNPNHFADIATLGGGVLSSLSMNVLGNSDFYTSAFPAEYSNAVSGVFDMKMRNGNAYKHEHTFQAGLLGFDFASEGPFHKNHQASYLFNYRYSTTGLIDKMRAGDQNNQLLDYQDFNFKLNFPSKKAGVFSVWGTGLQDKFRTKKEEQSTWKYIDDGKSSQMQQTSAAAGITYRYFPENGGTLRATVASTFSKNKALEDYYDDTEKITPHLNLDNRYTNLILTSSFDKAYSKKHTNKTGFTFTNMHYNMNLGLAPAIGNPLAIIAEGKGNTNLISMYSSSLIELSPKVSATIGFNTQLLTLNNHWTAEPRAAVKWQSSSKTSLALAYGLHSRMEKLDVYYLKDNVTGRAVNKDLDFTKTHHVSLSYNYRLSADMHLKVEPYFQYLFQVPVIADSSYSILNRSLFYVEDVLVNKGRGTNFGIDLTLEKYFTNGFYYMVTTSVFDSRYTGGDAVWHSTKYNRNFIVNGLAGKEWMMGKQKRDILGINLKLTLQGGNRYSPVNTVSSLSQLDKETQYDERMAYANQFAPMFLANYSITYRMNRSNRSHEFAIKWLNFTRTAEYYGHAYNLQNGTIEPKKQVTSLFNMLYRIDF